ncbi:response regulator transcription factor [Oceanobacillus oncorhynchi]|uniref:response regulator transcription factor n=2 Tax=Oceanobacillus oncorhynchi TaxID=545501 RepID=UPI002F96AE6B
MMKVLIADDEVIIREGISNIIPWSELGFTLLKPVSSAEEVIKQLELECPDILISDIRMKGMTGLELVSYIAKHNYQIESILLTGYDDFEYIQEAIRQNVCDYLLKTSSPDEIISAAERARKRLEKVKEYDHLKISEEERNVNNHIRAVLQNESAMFDYPYVVKSIPILTEPPYQLLLIDAVADSNSLQAHEELWNSYINGKWISLHSHTLILVKREKYLKDDYLLQVASRKIKEIYQKPIIMSSIVSSLDELPDLYKRVVSFIPYQWVLPDQPFLIEKDISNRNGIPYSENIIKHKDELMNCIKEGNEENLKKWVSDLVDWLFCHPNATPESIQFYVQNLYIESIRFINHLGGTKGIDKYDSMPPIQKWFAHPKEALFSLFFIIFMNYKISYQKSTNYVEDSIMYMEKHLGEPITLKEIAAEIPVHPNYLSDVIRKKTGKSYVELLTDLRVKKASEYLMYTSISVKEITQLVGYNDSKYFTKIFKKSLGMTPTQYRDTNMHIKK